MRSDSAPHNGSAKNWPRLKKVNIHVTCQAWASRLWAKKGINGTTMPKPTRLTKTTVNMAASALLSLTNVRILCSKAPR